MFSIRLNENLRDQLDFLALRTGEARNSIIAKALSDYLSSRTLGGVPLEEGVQENSYEIHEHYHAQSGEMVDKFKDLKRWIEGSVIWTKNGAHPETRTGKPTPGILGRNVVTGYYVERHEISVISKHVTWPPATGLDSFHLYVTPYEDWVEYMREVPRKV